MTTNKPGSDQQQPLYGCVSCLEYQTFPADHLRVYEGNCYCEDCWDAYPADADIEWTSLDSFTPTLQAECEKLRAELDQYKTSTPALLLFSRVPRYRISKGQAEDGWGRSTGYIRVSEEPTGEFMRTEDVRRIIVKPLQEQTK